MKEFMNEVSLPLGANLRDDKEKEQAQVIIDENKTSRNHRKNYVMTIAKLGAITLGLVSNQQNYNINNELDPLFTERIKNTLTEFLIKDFVQSIFQ